MNYAQIRKMDITNGEGVRISLFVQGCEFHCKGCFNSETWDWNGGKEFTQKEMDILMDLCNKPYIKGLSILGGEPLHPNNISTVTNICKQFKTLYPNKDIWIWTGYKLDEYILQTELDDAAKVLEKVNKEKHTTIIHQGEEINYNESINDLKDLLNVCDVVIDGQFEEDKKDLSLKFRGSTNQRIWRKSNKGEWYIEQ